MGMGFGTKPLEPKHLVALSDGDVVEILAAFDESDRAPWKFGEEGFITRGGPALYEMLKALPGVYNDEGVSGPANLSERGEQALVRMVAGVRLSGTLDFYPPGVSAEATEELRAAMREEELADAHLTISLAEGKPGPERSAIVDRRTAAQERLRLAALEFGLQAMQHAVSEGHVF